MTGCIRGGTARHCHCLPAPRGSTFSLQQLRKGPEGRKEQEKLSCKGCQLLFSTLRGSSSVYMGLVFVKHPAPDAQTRSTLFLPSF